MVCKMLEMPQGDLEGVSSVAKEVCAHLGSWFLFYQCIFLVLVCNFVGQGICSDGLDTILLLLNTLWYLS
jgi:hypothetical protein